MLITTPAAGPPQRLIPPSGHQLVSERQGERTTIYKENAVGAITSASEGGGHDDNFVRRLLLPSGYPQTVTPDYGPSRKWAFVKNMSGGVASYFGTVAVVNSMGYGAVGPITAAMAWMFRNAVSGVGKLGGSFVAPMADQNPRGWSFNGQLINTVGVGMEASLAVVPQAFIVLAPVSNILQGLGSTTMGAAQASINKHQASHENIGELRAKNANQEMLASGIGAALGYGIQMAGNAVMGPASVPLFAAGAGAVSVMAQARYARALEMNDLNEANLRSQARAYLHGGFTAPETPKLLKGSVKRWKRSHHRLKLVMGSPVKPLLDGGADHFHQLTEMYKDRNYLLDWKGDTLRVVLKNGSDNVDQALALMQAETIESIRHSDEFQRLHQDSPEKAVRWAEQQSLEQAPHDRSFVQQLGKLGWDASRILIRSGSARADW